MESSISDFHIKHEESDVDLCSPTVIASKIYTIEEQADQKNVLGPRIIQLCEPKEEVLGAHDMSINEPQFGENEGDIYEDFFIMKEEFEEPSSSGSEFIDEAYEEDTAKDYLNSGSRNIAGVVEGNQKDNPHLNQIMLCPYCGIEFENWSDWRQHLNNIHEFNKFESLNMEYINGKVKCKECSLKMGGQRHTLENHKITHLPFKRYIKCKLCEKLFTRVRSHVQHFDLIHNLVGVEYDKSNLKDIPCETNIILSCPYCGKEYENNSEWRQHLNDIHDFNKFGSLNMEDISPKKAKCKQCKMEVRNQMQSLQFHRITHLPHKKYVKCKLCKKTFTSGRMNKRHLERFHSVIESKVSQLPSNSITCHPNATFICPICGIEFENYFEWQEHGNSIHEFNKREKLNMDFFDENRAKCKECDMELSCVKTRTLLQHRIRHLPYPQFIKCKLCALKFSHFTTFRTHFRKTHRNQPQTDTNSISTPFESNTHNPILLCPYCGEESTNLFEWRNHLNCVHEFEKPEKLNMEYLGNNKAKCKECDMEMISNRKWSLEQHRIEHLPYSQYIKCKLCALKFSHYTTFKTHIKKAHRNQPQTDTNSISSTFESNTTNKPIVLCPYCGEESPNLFEWRNHLNWVHEFKNPEKYGIFG